MPLKFYENSSWEFNQKWLYILRGLNKKREKRIKSHRTVKSSETKRVSNAGKGHSHGVQRGRDRQAVEQ